MTAPASTCPTAETWQIAAEIDWRSWDSEIVAYNGRTGDTHHFADFAAWLFTRLARQPADAAALAAAATQAVELRSGELPRVTVDRTLALFCQFDLLDRIAV
ncbi:MAG: HPr-rel-A system PqqD family peptide chaperone [Alphaproteobacteria bacterium]|nr:HPr-rel-A system PqqD family peptide chaperone [Alphaproteobacteria bacterium]